MRASISALVVVTLLGLAACDQKQQASITRTSSGAGETATYTVENASGSAQMNFGPGATARMPGWLPLYPGAAVQTSINGSGTGGAGGTVIFKTSAPVAAVIAFYKQKASAAGMAESMNMTSGAMTTFAASRQGTRSALQVIATSANDGTGVQVVWSQN